MKKTLTYILVVALVAVLLSGCRKEPVADKSVAFFAVCDETKASVSSETEMRGSAICPIGAHTAGTAFSGTPMVDFSGDITLSYLNATEGWTYSDKRSWVPNSTYRFRAYWPYSAGISFTDDYTSTLTLANFTTTSDPATQPDLMLADFYERSTTTLGDPAEYARVPLHFEHLLCKVGVNVQLRESSTTLTFSITNVSINNVKPKGTYTLDYQDATSQEGVNVKSGAWTAGGSELRYARKFEPAVTLTWDTTEGEGVPVNVWAGGLMLIPQELSAVNLTIDYFILQEGKEPQERTATMALPAEPAWTPGTKITYNVYLKRDDKIVFGIPSVELWGTSAASGAILIK